MPHAELTTRFVRRAACPSGRQRLDYFDTRLTGFLLEVRPSGRRTFCLHYADLRGRKHQVKIGPTEVLTIAQASKKAREAATEILIGAESYCERERVRATPMLAAFAREQCLPRGPTIAAGPPMRSCCAAIYCRHSGRSPSAK